MALLALLLLRAALLPLPACPHAHFVEELAVTPLEAAAPWASTLHPGHSLVSLTLAHDACAEDAAAGSFIPPAWQELLLGSGGGAVRALSASLAAGRVPSGWRLPAWAARSSGGSALPTDAAPGARLLLTLGAPGAAAAAAPSAEEWAQWDRAVRLASRAARASLTGTATAPRALPLGGAASAQGVSRDWYAHAYAPAGGARHRVVELAVPRAALCVEALWGAVAASPCRGHAGLGAALAPSAIVGAPWHALSWEASVEAADSAAAGSSGSGSAGNGSTPRACRALRLTAAVHAVLPTGSSSSSLAALRQLLQVPEAWGAAVPSTCPLAARSTLRLHAANGSAAVYPLGALAAAAGSSGGGARASSAPAPPPPSAPHLLRACLFTTRVVSPPYPALGLLSVLTSVRNGCSEGAWREALAGAGAGEGAEGGGAGAGAPAQRHYALVLSAALPWMLAPVEGTEVAWVEEGQRTRGSAGAAARAAAAAAAVAGGGGGGGGARRQDRGQGQQQPRGPALLRSTLPLPLPPPGACLHHAVQLRCCGGGSPGQQGGLLHSEEGPPDAARGLEVPPARLRLVRQGEGAAGGAEEAGAEWMAEGGTVEVPAVDASMPYNVLVLVSTVAAFACGAVVNAVARARG